MSFSLQYFAKIASGLSYRGVDGHNEWHEATRYSHIKRLGKKAWINALKSGHSADWNSLGHVHNHEPDLDKLEPEKVQRVHKEIKGGAIDYPIVGRGPDGSHELIAGNTRVATLLKMKQNPKVWIVHTKH